jgi:hypothetical protein
MMTSQLDVQGEVGQNKTSQICKYSSYAYTTAVIRVYCTTRLEHYLAHPT